MLKLDNPRVLERFEISYNYKRIVFLGLFTRANVFQRIRIRLEAARQISAACIKKRLNVIRIVTGSAFGKMYQRGFFAVPPRSLSDLPVSQRYQDVTKTITRTQSTHLPRDMSKVVVPFDGD